MAACGGSTVGDTLATTAAPQPVATSQPPESAPETSTSVADPPVEIPPELAAFGVETVTVAGEPWTVAVADTSDERFQGLRRIADLGELDGMLFVYDAEVDTAFTMRTVPIPLEIGFFGGDGRLFEVLRMEPCDDSPDCPTYRPSAPFRWAIETEVGRWVGVSAGDTLAREN